MTTKVQDRKTVPNGMTLGTEPETYLVAYQLHGQPALWTWCGQADSPAAAQDQALQVAKDEGWAFEDLRCRLVLSGHQLVLHYPSCFNSGDVEFSVGL